MKITDKSRVGQKSGTIIVRNKPVFLVFGFFEDRGGGGLNHSMDCAVIVKNACYTHSSSFSSVLYCDCPLAKEEATGLPGTKELKKPFFAIFYF